MIFRSIATATVGILSRVAAVHGMDKNPFVPLVKCAWPCDRPQPSPSHHHRAARSGQPARKPALLRGELVERRCGIERPTEPTGGLAQSNPGSFINVRPSSSRLYGP